MQRGCTLNLALWITSSHSAVFCIQTSKTSFSVCFYTFYTYIIIMSYNETIIMQCMAVRDVTWTVSPGMCNVGQ